MFFKDFPATSYKFGTETQSVVAQNISAYVDIFDDIKDQLDFYQYYDLYDERPDQLSFKLYDDVSFYWTFYLLNDHIRRSGWPINANELEAWTQKRLDHTVITTRDELLETFMVGDTIEGVSSAETGTITKRVEDLGQIFIAGTKSFTDGELIQDANGNTLTVHSSVPEYNAVKHYLDADGEFADIDPTSGPGAEYTAVTYSEYLADENDKLRKIKVIKPEAINGVVSAFREALRSQ